MNDAEQSKVFDKLPPYYLREDFLGRELVARLLDYALNNHARFQQSTVGITENERVNLDWRVSSIMWDFGDLKPELKACFKRVLPDAIQHLKLSAFELYKTELELVAHGNGAFYNTHIDTAIDKNDETVRVLTAVYYFHAEPKVFSGGNIRLLPIRNSPEEQNYIDIEPCNDRLLIFPSWVPHRVMPVLSESTDFKDSRFAINCWYRKKKA